ncbi:MAG: hypothetical protein ACM31C_26315 [Acidobacteriota bacterium]
MRLALPLLLAACGPSTRPPTPVASHAAKDPAPAGFAACDLVTLDSKGVVTAWRFVPSGVEALGHVTVGKPMSLELPEDRAYARPMKAGWADREHLFVSPDTQTVLMVTADGIDRLAVPDLAKQVPQPDGASETGGGKEYTRVDLVVRDGEAWWSRCPWSFPNDGGYCAGWISARLWPSATTVNKDVEPRDVRWQEVAGHPACEPPPPDDEHELYGAHWLAADRLLVLWGYHSEFDSPPPDRWELRDRCDGKPLATGDDPAPAPEGLWLSREGDARVIHRGTAVIGHVPDDGFGALAIRPTSRRR